MKNKTRLRCLFPFATALLAGLALAPAAGAVVRGDTSAAVHGATGKCHAVTVLTVRGTNDALTSAHPDGEVLSPVVARIKGSDVDVLPIQYSASPANNHHPSYEQGRDTLVTMMKSTNQNCPRTTVVLAGFSLGAWVIDGALNIYRPANLKAVVLYGDPAFDPRDSYDRGTFNQNHPVRSGPEARAGLAPKLNGLPIASYCDKADSVCQQSTIRPDTHTLYGQSQTYLGAGVNFINSRI